MRRTVRLIDAWGLKDYTDRDDPLPDELNWGGELYKRKWGITYLQQPADPAHLIAAQKMYDTRRSFRFDRRHRYGEDWD